MFLNSVGAREYDNSRVINVFTYGGAFRLNSANCTGIVLHVAVVLEQVAQLGVEELVHPLLLLLLSPFSWFTSVTFLVVYFCHLSRGLLLSPFSWFTSVTFLVVYFCHLSRGLLLSPFSWFTSVKTKQYFVRFVMRLEMLPFSGAVFLDNLCFNSISIKISISFGRFNQLFCL